MASVEVPGTESARTIEKDRAFLSPRPNLYDYEEERARFDWPEARKLLDGLPGGRGFNIAHEAVDRHAAGARAEKVAIRWIGKTGARRDLTYRDLQAETNRFANALASLGVRPGERVFILLGRLPELYIALLGALKARCVVSPLFSAFGPEPIATRVGIGEGRVLVTTPDLYRRKVESVRERMPSLSHVILVGDGEAEGPGLQRWPSLVDAASPEYEIGATDPCPGSALMGPNWLN